MQNYFPKLEKMRKDKNYGYWGERILSQLVYGQKLSEIHQGQYNELLQTVMDEVYTHYSNEDGITEQVARQAEQKLSELSDMAKSYKMICVAHAHIDMNWMWRWDETVQITIDTFRTMLDLMDEYPDFKFSQSQASVYQILEDYAPHMLNQVKARVHEGRWEVTASTWVEADKNMPNGESMARHILYTRKYLSELLDIDGETLNLNFEPDTFGHSINVPEVLASGGIKYYYHCRGYDKHILYRWQAPSGQSIIVYREPLWYNAAVDPTMALYVPQFCAQHGMDTMLKVYGVGDHGGGPTRRDLERIIDMNTWPVFPKITFGTYNDFFTLVEQNADDLPVVKDELNFIFTGCYTSQARIKQANRMSESALYEAEAFNTFANMYIQSPYNNDAFEKGWINTLFNQFHDIIPGSGTVDTLEHAMGLFQETLAISGSSKSQSLSAISQQVDTSMFADQEDSRQTVSEGAGVGFGIGDFKVSQANRGRGKTRIFHIFNPSPVERYELAELVIWDWDGDIQRIRFNDEHGNKLEHQLLDNGFNKYWGHSFIRILVRVRVPACGYTTCVMTEEKLTNIHMPYTVSTRVEESQEFVLENNRIKAVFDPRNAALISMVDKATGHEFIDRDKAVGVFQLIEEDPSQGMTSWRVGRIMSAQSITQNVRMRMLKSGYDALRQSLQFEAEFGKSKLKVIVSLDVDRPELHYSVECDWHELGTQDTYIPQLSFHMPLGYECEDYQYNIPFGTIERKAMNLDVPANSWAMGIPKQVGQKPIMLITDSKYGFRGIDDSINLTLIRGSFDPDPYPEQGINKFKFAIGVVDGITNRDRIEQAAHFNHPFNAISASIHSGTLPLSQSFMEIVQGSNIAVSAIKRPELNEEGEKNLLVRVYETEGQDGKATIRFFDKPLTAYYVDIHEQKIDMGYEIEIRGDKIIFDVPANKIISLCIRF